ncbi:hypothetical protein V2J09_014673 [Rumex salicifolius]
MASLPPAPPTASPPSTASSWSSLVTQPAKLPARAPPAPTTSVRQVLDGCKSSKGVSVSVVDANAIIQGGERLSSFSDRFVSVAEVMNEIRDPTSRHRLSVLPFTVETMEPSPESLKKVVSFARETGDLQTLSDVDIKLIALTYTLEAQIHGTKHLRDNPPPVHMLNVRRLPEKDLPGWGSNVPNLEEWEALEVLAEYVPSKDSKILPLKDLSLNVQCEDNVSLQDGSVGNGSENCTLDDDHSDKNPWKFRKYPIKKTEVKIDGKKMVADGVDASQGQFDEDAGDWNPAVSRSTRRRFLRRQARRETIDASHNNGDQADVTENTESEMKEEPDSYELALDEDRTDEIDDVEISSAMKEMRLQGDDVHNDCEVNNEGSEHFETLSQTTDSVDTSYVDDLSSEQTWSLRSLSESSVACVTGDFAMQNVILQMGLRLVAPGGMQIRELHRWVLKCHACYKVTNEIGRIFCPKCGNGGTLRKVAVTVGENGIVLAAHRQRFSLRGTKFSLPLPQSGRDAITKNPILREDQLPQRFGGFLRDDRRSNAKKKANDNGMDFFVPNDIFSGRADRKEPLKPPVKQALTMFSGRRNPNDNHNSRAKH